MCSMWMENFGTVSHFFFLFFVQRLQGWAVLYYTILFFICYRSLLPLYRRLCVCVCVCVLCVFCVWVCVCVCVCVVCGGGGGGGGVCVCECVHVCSTCQ